MFMVRQHTLKTNILRNGLIAFGVMSTIGFATSSLASATTQNATFQVNLQESLTVSLTVPDNGDSGSLTYDSTSDKWVSDLLRNVVNLNVTSNNPAGFTASMTSDSTTSAALTNKVASLSSDTIPTLSADWTRSNTTNTKFWGWSINDSSETGTYHQIALKNATPNTVIPATNSAGTVNQDIYFGAKADSTIASGTYEGTVIISVVTGVITTPDDNPNDNPVIPDNPVDPGNLTPNTPTYNSTTNVTAYTSTSSDSTNNTTTNTTKLNPGNTVSYSYADPAGVTTTVVNEGTPLATGLAITSAIAATTGIFFLIAAKRRKDDDEEEYQQ